MALFDNKNNLRCEKCGSTVFIEKPKYMYERKDGHLKNLIYREKIGVVLECANPKCEHKMDMDNIAFFKDAETIDIE